MDFHDLRKACADYRAAKGDNAVAALVTKHGGSYGKLKTVPSGNWATLHAAFRAAVPESGPVVFGQGTMDDGDSPKSLDELAPAAFKKWNSAGKAK